MLKAVWSSRWWYFLSDKKNYKPEYIVDITLTGSSVGMIECGALFTNETLLKNYKMQEIQVGGYRFGMFINKI
jgi:hypothetical protein